MSKIKCLQCGEIEERREGTKFCSPKCKNAYHNSGQKSEPMLVDNLELPPLETFRNVSNPINVCFSTIPDKYIKENNVVENPLIKIRKELIDRMRLKVQEKSNLINQYRKPIVDFFEVRKAKYLSVAHIGNFTEMQFNEAYSNQPLMKPTIDMIKENASKIERIKKEMAELENEINEGLALISLMRLTMETSKTKLNPNWVEYERLELHRSNQSKQVVLDAKQTSDAKEIPLEDIEPESQESDKSIIFDKNSKVICSANLAKFEFKSIAFNGIWNAFLGRPSTDFYMVLHGKPGSGKSTFSVKFAHYLAENFGKTIYISGEEGFSKSFNDKLNIIKAHSEDLFIADLHSYEEIITNLERDKFGFIIIDSLNNLNIDAPKLKELRDIYNCAIIAIAQSTKAGSMRGSQVITHDCDIEVYVEKGVAVTLKNRFCATDKVFEIFPSTPRTNTVLVRNTI